MTNQPKITYRSDTTGCLYQMMQRSESFTIQVINFDDVIIDEVKDFSNIFLPWRSTINKFFDIITTHINTGKWE